MESLQIISIKNIINNISDNEQLSLLIDCINKRFRENVNQKYKEHYWSREDGKFDEKLKSSTFDSNDGANFNCEENLIRYRFNEKLEGCPLLVRDVNLKKFWKFNGTYNNFSITGHKVLHTYECKDDIQSLPEDVLDYALFLWKHKP